MGRPSTYSREIADDICRRVANGETLSEVCRDPNMPPRQTVVQWYTDDRDGFAGRYARAKEHQIEYWAEELLSISDDGRNDWMERNDPGNRGWQINGEHVQRSRLRADNRKWLLSKLNPKKYGERTAITGADGKDLIPDTRATDNRIIALLMKAGMSEADARAALDADAG